MSHSIRHQFVHLMWATKNAALLISDEMKSALLAYLTGTIKGLGGIILATAATSNHVHLLVNTPANISISELLRQLKSCSSKWYRENNTHNISFAWTEGYSAFTVSPTSIEDVKKYLISEDVRHQNSSYQDELIRFLKIQEIDFNPEYLINTTYSRLIYHLVWAVKNREAMLPPSMKIPLHQHFESQILGNGDNLYAIGNVEDHIHLLIEVTSKTSVASLVQKLKTTSTYLIQSQRGKRYGFSWQEGYGVFSVGRPLLNIVTNYVNNQEDHHKNNSFDEEWDWFKTSNINRS